MRRTFFTDTLIVFTILCAASSALAETEGPEPSIVFLDLYLKGFEAEKTPEYVGGIQEDITQYRKYALMPREEATASIRQQMVTPERRVNDQRLQSIEKLVDQGDKLLYTNRQKALSVLRKANDELQNISESLRLNANVRKFLFRTKMLLLRSHLDNNNASKARTIMDEVVRFFEDSYLSKITEENYHPKTVDLYKEVSREMKKKQTASVTITTTPPGCEVFINGQPQKDKTPFTFKNLFAGKSMIQVQMGDKHSMVHKIDLPTDETQNITIDLAYESAMTLSDKRLGFTFVDKAAVAQSLASYAGRMGRMLEVDFVAVAGVVSSFEGPVLVGYLYRTRDDKLIRETQLSVKTNVVSVLRIRQLSAFFAGTEVGAGSPWYSNVYGWSLVGAGAISLGVSFVYVGKYVQHKDCAEDKNCKTEKARLIEADKASDAQLLAGVLGGVGGALIVGGVLVFILDRDDDEAKSANSFWKDSGFVASPVILPDGGGLHASWRF